MEDESKPLRTLLNPLKTENLKFSMPKKITNNAKHLTSKQSAAQASNPWTLYNSEEGYPYYYNHITGESQWADMRESAARSSAESACELYVTTATEVINKSGDANYAQDDGSDIDEEDDEDKSDVDVDYDSYSEEDDYTKAVRERREINLEYKFRAFLDSNEGGEIFEAEMERIRKKFEPRKKQGKGKKSAPDFFTAVSTNAVASNIFGFISNIGSTYKSIYYRGNSNSKKLDGEVNYSSSNDLEAEEKIKTDSHGRHNRTLSTSSSASSFSASSSSDSSISTDDSDLEVLKQPLVPEWLRLVQTLTQMRQAQKNIS